MNKKDSLLIFASSETTTFIEEQIKKHHLIFTLFDVIQILEIYRKEIAKTIYKDANKKIENEIPTQKYKEIFGDILYIFAKVADLHEKGEWDHKKAEKFEIKPEIKSMHIDEEDNSQDETRQDDNSQPFFDYSDLD